MCKYVSIFVFILNFFSGIQAQNQYQTIDATMDKMPDNLENDTSKIVNFINTNFTTNEDKLRAAFYWTASTISYDVVNMLNQKPNQSTDEKIATTLKSKKGVCMHYAEIFSDISNKLGIKTIQISGYTKDATGKIPSLSHVWNASFLDGKWYLFDTTWASGYVENNKYIKKLNNKYYKSIPSNLIKTHMPFDYLWQFSEYPITNQEFYDGKSESLNKTKFDFLREIEQYENATSSNKSIAAAERIKKNGLKNKMINEYLNFEIGRSEYYNEKTSIAKFEDIVARFNEANTLHNAFVKYRNERFIPSLPDEEIKSKIQVPYDMVLQCQQDLEEINDIRKENQGNIVSLRKALESAKNFYENNLKFTNDYLAITNESARKKMFFTTTRTTVKRRN